MPAPLAPCIRSSGWSRAPTSTSVECGPRRVRRLSEPTPCALSPSLFPGLSRLASPVRPRAVDPVFTRVRHCCTAMSSGTPPLARPLRPALLPDGDRHAMSKPPYSHRIPPAFALITAVTLTLTACGSGGSADTTGGAAPAGNSDKIPTTDVVSSVKKNEAAAELLPSDVRERGTLNLATAVGGSPPGNTYLEDGKTIMRPGRRLRGGGRQDTRPEAETGGRELRGDPARPGQRQVRPGHRQLRRDGGAAQDDRLRHVHQ